MSERALRSTRLHSASKTQFVSSRHKFKLEGNGRQHEFNLFHHEEIDRALSLLERDEEIAGADLKGITTKE
ncbi:Hypothetical predicted protein [Mytilus galloprovincialis]|uniref:Uncharacterized protein n=1 Tax=Mytilus galloprovincialis TaxID=29158 RepID=A0A8B6FGD5_MYTGA|nr:Hypothetical predicted protein [Mytilus galloprovincialis]